MEVSTPPQPGGLRALRQVARDVIAVPDGGRVPTAQELQRSVGVGAGTIQKAFWLLENLGALSTKTRGHQGRYIVDRDLGRLWRLGELPAIQAFLTPPGAREVYGFVEALRSQFARTGIPLEIVHVRGGEERLARARAAEAGFAVVSAGVGRTYAGQGAEGLVARPLSQGTYYAAGSIVVLSRAGIDPGDPSVRIGVDPASFDHREISEAQFGPLHLRQVVEVPFPNVPPALLRGEIDVGVWHRMLLLIPPELTGLSCSPLSDAAASSVAGLSQAVLVTRSDNPYLPTIFDAVDWDEVARRQDEAMTQLSLESADTWYR